MGVNPAFERLALLTGEEGLEKLTRTKALIFGAGGVGSWVAEALVRCGIGKLGIIDNDTVCASNINRQAEATSLTLGLPKVSALKKRLLEINSECEITSWDELFCRDNAHIFDIESANFVIDAIDTINHKLDLIEKVHTYSESNGVTLYSSMGMALRMDPTQIKIASIWDTHGCPLARHVRQGLRKRGFPGDFSVVYSSEIPCGNLKKENDEPPRGPGEKRINGSNVTVTASAGFMLAGMVLKKALLDETR
ncbi:MAG: tRNA threonylcarbamoyladenosine dehydratase [Treponema sp.]|nr:tRNA threonylcarbamoyladenosine dehydratase [Treponema sp.]